MLLTVLAMGPASIALVAVRPGAKGPGTSQELSPDYGAPDPPQPSGMLLRDAGG